LLDDFLRSFDITLLPRLVSASEHDNQEVSSAREVQPIPWPDIYSHFLYITANGLPIAEISSLHQTQPRDDANLRAPITQPI
jgi:hypothetical protein